MISEPIFWLSWVMQILLIIVVWKIAYKTGKMDERGKWFKGDGAKWD